jgi:ribonuclease-3
MKNILGFSPRNVRLYKLAFIHKSAAEEVIKGVKTSNERMEYLGDAVLSSVVADFLFHKYPLKDEGFLTQMRSKIVSRASLNRLALKMGLKEVIVAEFDLEQMSKSIYGDSLEALLGAIYLDKGYRFAKKIIVNRIILCYLNIEEIEKQDLSQKSTLFEYAQKEKKQLEFKVIDTVGNGKRKQYMVVALLDNVQIAKGYGYSIKEAELNAATHACLELNATNSVSVSEPEPLA